MYIKDFIFKNKKIKKNKIKTPASGDNPFVKGAEGRSEWNDRYMNMSKMIRRWQIAFFSAIISVVILSIVIGKIATEAKVQPFVVETNNGMPYAVKPMEAISYKDQKLINFAINQYIINARTVISDVDAEKALLNKLYAYTANNAISFLHDYYETNNPFDRASQYNVTVSIVNSLPIGKDSWQVTWDETKHNTNGGNVLATSRWVANLTYQIGDVNPNFITDNPFGFYITQISWSQSNLNKLEG
jgi:type IV secretory pathway TrbF-like protein